MPQAHIGSVKLEELALVSPISKSLISSQPDKIVGSTGLNLLHITQVDINKDIKIATTYAGKWQR